MLTHIPYRQWCQHCVSGKAKGNPHHKVGDRVREVPTIAMDYMTMKEAQGIGDDSGMPILVGCDMVTAAGGTRHIRKGGAGQGGERVRRPVLIQ